MIFTCNRRNALSQASHAANSKHPRVAPAVPWVAQEDSEVHEVAAGSAATASHGRTIQTTSRASASSGNWSDGLDSELGELT